MERFKVESKLVEIDTKIKELKQDMSVAYLYQLKHKDLKDLSDSVFWGLYKKIDAVAEMKRVEQYETHDTQE